MSDSDLEILYKTNINESHAAGLRGVFDAGYQIGAGQPLNGATADASLVASATLATSDTPTIGTP